MELRKEDGGERAVKYTHGVKTNANVYCNVRYVTILVLKKAGVLGMLSHSLPCPCTVTL